jgi:hypothetical protein
MNFIVSVLICAAAGGPCTKIVVPEPDGLAPSLAMCQFVGQAYIAQTELVQEGDTVRVRCTADRTGRNVG